MILSLIRWDGIGWIFHLGFLAKIVVERGVEVKLGQTVAILVENKDDIAAFANYAPPAAKAAKAPEPAPAAAPKQAAPAAPAKSQPGKWFKNLFRSWKAS